MSLSKLRPQIAKKYLRWCVLSHFDALEKIDVISDYGIKIGDDSFFTSSLAPLYLVWDLDKTLTAEDSNTVYEEYNDILCSLNPKIEHNCKNIKKCIEEIDNSPSDFSEHLESYNHILRKCDFTKDQHIEASIRTGESKNVKIIPNIYDAILEQQKMNCISGINTGSPKDAATAVSERKIGIQKDFIEGSIPKFDRNGKFVGFWFNLGTNKGVSMSNFYQKSYNCYCDCSFVAEEDLARKIYVTDDLSGFEKYTIAKIGSLLGIVLFVSEKEIIEIYKRPGEFIINAFEIRKDARKINSYLDLYRRAKIFVRLHDPKEAKFIFNCVKEIKKLKLIEKNLIQCHELNDRISKFLSTEILFPILTTKFKRKIVEFEDAILKEDSKTMKRMADDLIEILEKNDPMFHLKEKREHELNEIIAQI